MNCILIMDLDNIIIDGIILKLKDLLNIKITDLHEWNHRKSFIIGFSTSINQVYSFIKEKKIKKSSELTGKIKEITKDFVFNSVNKKSLPHSSFFINLLEIDISFSIIKYDLSHEEEFIFDLNYKLNKLKIYYEGVMKGEYINEYISFIFSLDISLNSIEKIDFYIKKFYENLDNEDMFQKYINLINQIKIKKSFSFLKQAPLSQVSMSSNLNSFSNFNQNDKNNKAFSNVNSNKSPNFVVRSRRCSSLDKSPLFDNNSNYNTDKYQLKILNYFKKTETKDEIHDKHISSSEIYDDYKNCIKNNSKKLNIPNNSSFSTGNQDNNKKLNIKKYNDYSKLSLSCHNENFTIDNSNKQVKNKNDSCLTLTKKSSSSNLTEQNQLSLNRGSYSNKYNSYIINNENTILSNLSSKNIYKPHLQSYNISMNIDSNDIGYSNKSKSLSCPLKTLEERKKIREKENTHLDEYSNFPINENSQLSYMNYNTILSKENLDRDTKNMTNPYESFKLTSFKPTITKKIKLKSNKKQQNNINNSSIIEKMFRKSDENINEETNFISKKNSLSLNSPFKCNYIGNKRMNEENEYENCEKFENQMKLDYYNKNSLLLSNEKACVPSNFLSSTAHYSGLNRFSKTKNRNRVNSISNLSENDFLLAASTPERQSSIEENMNLLQAKRNLMEIFTQVDNS